MLKKACKSFNTFKFTDPRTNPPHPPTYSYRHTHKLDLEKEKRKERMNTGAAEMMLQRVFDGSLSIHDVEEIKQRPYHRNCSCALHKLRGVCSNACSQQKNISFPKKQSWTDCSFSIAASKFSSQYSLVDDLPVGQNSIKGLTQLS